MKKYGLPILTIAFALMLTGCSIASGNSSSQAKSIKIGSQEWTTRNLEVSQFRNGDEIPELKTDADWEKASQTGQPAWCYYENDAANGANTGKLYNWFAVNDPRGLAPEGWHVPSREEWAQVEENVGDDITIFSSQLGGFRHLEGNFRLIGSVSYYWTATETFAKVTAYERQIDYHEKLEEQNAGKGSGFSIRLVKD